MLEEKVVLVTGATGTLGRVVVERLLKKGAKVTVLYRTRERFEELVSFLGILSNTLKGVQGDATDETSVRNFVKASMDMYGRIDALLNLVGGYSGGSDVPETDQSLWDHMLQLNLKSAFLCSKAVLPQMISQNYGKIVNVAARTAVERGRRSRSGAYAVAKAGVIVLTETMAEELKKYDINVNCVMPSTLDTPDNRRDFPKADFSKWVDPRDVAEVVLFMISDASKTINGASIPVYGKA